MATKKKASKKKASKKKASKKKASKKKTTRQVARLESGKRREGSISRIVAQLSEVMAEAEIELGPSSAGLIASLLEEPLSLPAPNPPVRPPSSSSAPIRNWDRLPDSPNCVTIFGGGIAGLTAAHELVERGFQVQVWERQQNERHPEKGCDVGGLARTQWSAVRWPESRDVDPLPNQRLPFAGRRTRPIAHIRQLIYMTWSPGKFANLAGEVMVLDEVVDELLTDIAMPAVLRVQVYVHPEVWGRLNVTPDTFKQLKKEIERKKRIEVDLRSHEAPNVEWPLFIIDVADGLGRPLGSELHLWPMGAETNEGDGPRLSRPPIVGTFPLKAGPDPAPNDDAELPLSPSELLLLKFHVVRPNHNLLDALFGSAGPTGANQHPSDRLVSALWPDEKRRGTPARCVVKIYDTSAVRLTGGEFENRAKEVFEEVRALVQEQLDPSDATGMRSISQPTFGAMELAYDIRLAGGGVFRLEIQLHHSRRPDWTDISVQFGSQAPIHIRRFWSPTLEQIYVTPRDSQQGVTSSAESVVHDGEGKEALAKLVETLEARAKTEVVYVEVTSRQVDELSQAEKDRRVAHVRRMLEAEMGKRYELKLEYRWLDDFTYSYNDRPPSEVEVVVAFRPRERWLPGEHGYRFFPSFYHHLFDTMKRTPLLDIEGKPSRMQAQERAAGVPSPEPFQYVESGRSAFDNLHPTSSYVLAFGKAQRSSQLSRTPFTSLEEVREYLQIVFGPREAGGFGFSPRDVGRLVLKVLQFATSCEQRRKEYEEISWWDYLDGDTFSANAQYLLQRLPEALVAMDAHESDARTQWVPFIQILLDQIRAERYRDGTLRGPTTEAWLVPWRRYLEAQGVEFISGELEGFELIEVDGERRVHPRVFCFDPRYSENLAKPPLLPGYFVLAVSAEEARRLGEEYLALKNREQLSYDAKTCAHEEDSDLHTVASLGGDMSLKELDEELHQARPNSDFRHFAGLQYYFAEDVFWIDGHVYYPDSSWSITSISQARFWQDKMDWEHGYRGILSAIIGTWDVKSPALGKTAWECTEEELAEEVWRQIREGVQSKQARGDAGFGRFSRRTPLGALPEPLYWHLDQGISVELEKNGKVAGYRNRTPFLIAAPGRFSERPGSLETGHLVEHGFVLAGYYTQTYTRIPSMEAANESARHAVNAILKHLEQKAAPGYQFRRAYCDIWNPEDREVDDFRALKELDESLHAKGRPHVMELLDLDELTKNLLKGGERDPLDPLRILSRLTRMYQQA